VKSGFWGPRARDLHDGTAEESVPPHTDVVMDWSLAIATAAVGTGIPGIGSQPTAASEPPPLPGPLLLPASGG